MPPAIEPAGKKGFITTVESVRGIAALYVAVAHTMIYTLFAHYAAPILDLPTAREVVIRIVEGLIHGQMAVVVFFVISGLVIGRSLDGKHEVRTGHTYFIFLFRRMLRLYPAHIAATAGIIGIGWLFLTGRPAIDFTPYQPADDIYFTDWLNAVFNPLMLKTAIGNLTMARWSMNLVVWSLYVELCVAPLLPLFHRISRTNSVRADAATCAALLAVAFLTWDWMWCEYWFAFYFGMIVQTRGRDWALLVVKKIGSPAAAVTVSYIVMVVPAVVTAGRPPLVAVVEAAGAFSIVSLIVWCDKAATFRWLDHPLLRWNGRLSYSFYLWHFFILTMTVRGLYLVFSPEALHRYDVVVCVLPAVATVGAALGVAQLSYTFIELPFMEFSRRLAIEWRQRFVPGLAG
jgi:peptidoglycan/LPS O-acetylase OafA/YrhL